jgi:hypothetical protein
LAWYSGDLQVDLGPYVSALELQSYLPEALAGCSADRRLLAIPTWIEGRAWVCNSAAAIRSGFDIGQTVVWTWAEFEEACTMLKGAGYVPALVDPSSPDFDCDLGFEPAAAGGALESSALLSAPPAELARLVCRRDLARTVYIGVPDRDSIGAFRRGNVGFLAGCSPILSAEILRTASPETGFEPRLVPVPSTGVSPGPLRVNGAVVFRRPRDPGAVRAALAVELAKAISRAGSRPGLPPSLVPAFRPNLGRWTEEHGWNAVVALDSVRRGRVSPLRGTAELDTALAAREKARRDVRRGFRG